MCGIVGYIGQKSVVPILLEGLKNLEYRGYDSAGIAVNQAGSLQIIKATGKLINLVNTLEQAESKLDTATTAGIGHIRWATHGQANLLNAHPHTADQQKLALVHNGIIENFNELKTVLEQQGYSFSSQTDSEVAVKLIDSHYQQTHDLETAVKAAIPQLKGSFAFAVMHQDEPDKIIAIRKHAPLIIGVGSQGNFIASDITAIMQQTNQIIYLDDEELATVYPDKVTIQTLQGTVLNKTIETININAEAISKRGYKHFMLKEINEQAGIIRNTVANHQELFKDLPMADIIANTQHIEIVACGTSLHAALIAKYVLEELLQLRVEVEAASEYIYHRHLTDANTLVIGISQSGETADTITAVKQAKEQGARILVLTNRTDSNIVRYTDYTIPLNVGIEVSVAATKSYTAQLITLYLFTLALWEQQNPANPELAQLKQELAEIPAKLEQILSNTAAMEHCARRFYQHKAFIYMARGVNIASALEGALKLKEISYINANGYPAGELKHGPIALLDEDMPLVAVLMPGRITYDKMLSNCEEAKARNAQLIAITSAPELQHNNIFTEVILLPKIHEILSPLLVAVPMQLLAYYISDLLERNIDQPRNLAKSVTVE